MHLEPCVQANSNLCSNAPIIPKEMLTNKRNSVFFHTTLWHSSQADEMLAPLQGFLKSASAMIRFTSSASLAIRFGLRRHVW